jgi:hypothetical protein
MIRPHLQQRSRCVLIAARFAILAVAATPAVGCGDDNDGARRTPTPNSPAVATTTATRTPAPATPTITPPNASASAACTKLVGCQQCFSNATGQCIGTEECAGRLSGDVAICINGVGGCDQTALGGCLFFGCDGNDASGECQ